MVIVYYTSSMQNIRQKSVDFLVECKNLYKQYDGIAAVSNVTIDLPKNQIIGLLGLNGAGKTTTLSMISGILAPSSGSITFGEKSMVDDSIDCKSQLGFLPENLPIYPELTITEYLVYCAKLRRVKKKDIKDVVAKAITKCGLEGRTQQLISHLSKGYQQRTALAGAIIHSPPLLILDEPTSGLDPVQIHEIRNLIADLKKHHTVILSTHQLYEAELLSDRILIIHEGKIVLDKLKSEIGDDTKHVAQVNFKNPPQVAELEQLKGVTQVTSGEKGFMVHFEQGNNFDILLKMASEKGWQLTSLNEAETSLEKVFLQLTTKSKS